MSIGNNLERFVRNNHPELINLVGVLGLSAMDIFSFETWYGFAGLATLCTVYIPVAYRRNKINSVDSDEIDSLRQIVSEGHRNFFDVWDDKARETYKALRLGMRHRLSVYKFDEEMEQFRLLGRYADNDAYRQRHRVMYPKYQGVIGKAWDEGECFEKSLPNPNSNLEKYFDVNKSKYNMPINVTEQLSMKSQCLWAKTLRNEKDVPFAMVVVESTKRDDLDRIELTEQFDGRHISELQTLMKSLEFMEPSIKIAQDMGL